jgi:hypothetical protein
VLEIKLRLSSADCNCLIEAIESAKDAVEHGMTVYASGGYQTDNLEAQRSYQSVTDDIAATLKRLIEQEDDALIVFEP